jgi:DNA-binding transcriptional ArsR family regulator
MKTTEAISALAALAQSTRLDTFQLLVKREPEGVPAGELARRMAVPQNTMSAHLAILARAGLVIGERHSRSIIYRADLSDSAKSRCFFSRIAAAAVLTFARRSSPILLFAAHRRFVHD